MQSFFKNLEMRSVIALVSVTGAIGLAIANPQYGNAAINILGVSVGGYMGALQPHTSKGNNNEQ